MLQTAAPTLAAAPLLKVVRFLGEGPTHRHGLQAEVEVKLGLTSRASTPTSKPPAYPLAPIPCPNFPHHTFPTFFPCPPFPHQITCWRCKHWASHGASRVRSQRAQPIGVYPAQGWPRLQEGSRFVPRSSEVEKWEERRLARGSVGARWGTGKAKVLRPLLPQDLTKEEGPSPSP